MTWECRIALSVVVGLLAGGCKDGGDDDDSAVLADLCIDLEGERWSNGTGNDEIQEVYDGELGLDLLEVQQETTYPIRQIDLEIYSSSCSMVNACSDENIDEFHLVLKADNTGHRYHGGGLEETDIKWGVQCDDEGDLDTYPNGTEYRSFLLWFEEVPESGATEKPILLAGEAQVTTDEDEDIDVTVYFQLLHDAVTMVYTGKAPR